MKQFSFFIFNKNPENEGDVRSIAILKFNVRNHVRGNEQRAALNLKVAIVAGSWGEIPW